MWRTVQTRRPLSGSRRSEYSQGAPARDSRATRRYRAVTAGFECSDGTPHVGVSSLAQRAATVRCIALIAVSSALTCLP
jgi:hypothetical protein